LTELGTPSPTTFNLDSFLAQHRANMSLCTTVLDCADPQHKPSLVLLMQLISLLFHMVASFDQILLHRKKRDSHSEGQLHPDPSYPSTPPSRHRKEQVTHANLLRAELAKLGAMIQQFDRKYCGLENSVLAEDTFLLSPLFVNLQWKTQAKFDAVRSWMPWL
ncbi:hypothetical protein BJY04DRAFT_184819, partial [Aspergillus karnatakaensis]|uniref:uncharacterized protein n=1 Tax=Aspergillus karnatakaensis TaxID=1810916 RepID=UPI003CCDAFC5